uniref:Uncharacterized protein n=1 Tax=Myoviridae sp. ctA1z6 TaxID=2826627 RepID=A0A8S5M8G9_9CAUD|nr:MAG TPA: hypothetical protein [Myoviridae sp. ctA1z6]
MERVLSGHKEVRFGMIAGTGLFRAGLSPL